MQLDELIENLSKKAAELGIPEEDFFLKLREVMQQADIADISQTSKQFCEQQERIEEHRVKLAKRIERGARKTNGPLKFPV